MNTASADYTPEQIVAWARPERTDISAWDQSMRRRSSYVAVVDEQVAGFSDVSEEGYINLMYVAPGFTRRGVGRELITFLEYRARSYAARRLTANVSITAQAFFEAYGFQVEAEQHPVINGVDLTKFRMTKELSTRT
ncbi:GNAT family N-acetyltransferase [Enteractinococcus coprophilus]|uniref:Putative acetyltransferase n=1 Tax=Enteractinococcus coprophilus TaxID=1027633 RepID=A0A543A0M7_9MICC|nr:GNAT family N-acetyltransferase [Enteractinococcus coprophilus]TQL66036.1 putative acetyltransferase [Enteractinococcus coprophilus]